MHVCSFYFRGGAHHQERSLLKFEWKNASTFILQHLRMCLYSSQSLSSLCQILISKYWWLQSWWKPAVRLTGQLAVITNLKHKKWFQIPLAEEDSYRNICFIYIFPAPYMHIFSPRISMSLKQNSLAKCPLREESTIPSLWSLSCWLFSQFKRAQLKSRFFFICSLRRSDHKEQKWKCKIVTFITK